jgi:hypothetical protein
MCSRAAVVAPSGWLAAYRRSEGFPDERAPDTRALVIGAHAHLLHVGVPIDGVDKHVADRASGIVERDPASRPNGDGHPDLATDLRRP